MKYFVDIINNCTFVYQIKQKRTKKQRVMKTLKEANKEVKAFTNYTRDENETFTIEESTDCWEIFSNVFGDDKPATTYDKENWTYDEAVENYRKNGIY